MMAQLTEETQPSFETTLKSKAVSENCNVKFSCVVTGYPAPQVTWYKDDMQLDRYCGLPKYEIFRNGQSHSLHIYNCTVEDAAIYQTSAINSKGIVSCSGVLEVGEMNEFKIHQRYFAKLKQKAELKRKEAAGKENQEPLRPISPDRSQRKRRSTMEDFLSTPSSTEDEGSEENHQAADVETETRLQEVTAEEVKEKPIPVTNGVVSTLTNGQAVNDNGTDGGPHLNNSSQKTTSHQTKTPFVKKKIRISSNAKVAKADTCKERAPVERRPKDEASPSVAPVCTKAAESKGETVEAMEVENIVDSSRVDSDLKDVMEECQKQTTKVPMSAEKPLMDKSMCSEVTVSPQKELRQTASLPLTVTSTSHNLPGTEGKKSNTYEKKVGHKDAKGSSDMQGQLPPKQPQSSVPSTPRSTFKMDLHTKDPVTAMDVDVKSKASSGGPVAQTLSETVDKLDDSRTALHQRPCQPAGNQPSEKKNSPRLKKVPVSRAALPSEVTQAHAKMNRNGAPVSLEIPTNRHTIGSQPKQKTPTERKTQTSDIQTSSVHSSLQVPIDKIAQDTRDHSRESNESHKGLVTHLPKPSLKSRSGHENSRGCNVSSTVLQSQVDTAIKSVEGPEIKEDEKVECNEVGQLLVQAGRLAPNQKTVQMGTEPATQQKVKESRTEKTGEAVSKDTGQITVDASIKKTNKKEPISNMGNASPEIQTPTPVTKTPESSLEQVSDFQPIQQPETKVISIAEMLRSQIKALESPLVNSVSITPPQSDSVQDPSTLPSILPCQDLIHNDRKGDLEEKKSMLDMKTETSLDDAPPTNIKTTLVEVSNQVNPSDQNQNSVSAPIQVLQEPLVIPPISVIDAVITVNITDLPENANISNKGVMDIGQEIESSTAVPPTDFLVKQIFAPLTSTEELTNGFQSISNLPGPVGQRSGCSVTDINMKACIEESTVAACRNTKEEPFHGKDIGVVQNTSPVNIFNSKPKNEVTEINLAERYDQSKMAEHGKNTDSLKFSTEGDFSTGNNLNVIQHERSTVEESLKTDSSNPTPEPSPSLKKRICVSPIPSATPQELASGARRKILIPKTKSEEVTEATSPAENQTQRKEGLSPSNQLSNSPTTPSASPSLSRRSTGNQLSTSPVTPTASPSLSRRSTNSQLSTTPASPSPSPSLSRRSTSNQLSPSPVTPSASPSLSRRSPLLQPPSEQSPPVEKRSPLLSRRKMAPETPVLLQPEEIQTQEKPAEKDKHNPFKAPQVIRKIRGENFADASGHLKLWCQFFNVLSDSTIKWFKNEEQIFHLKRDAGDETPVNLAIVQASSKDFGVYGCSITNEYGSDATDILLSTEFLTGMSLREDLGVGEEIEMTPLIFSKGVADSGVWGNKLFGRIMMKESYIGDGCSHKAWRAKVIYGLEPVFESGNTCIIKAPNPIAYGGKGESHLVEKNFDIVKQECKIQNLAREYCKIFSAEARVIENFGPSLEVIPVYLMYRPANTVPHATVQTDLTGEYQRYSALDHTGRIEMRTGSEVEQKCCALQHWIFQWTNGNLLFTRLEGVDTKITSVGISVKSTGHQGLSVEGNPKVFDQFVSQHKCNYFCGLLGLRSLKVMDSLLTPSKSKGSRSPLLQRKMAAGSSSPQTGRKASGSPRLPRKAEQDGSKTAVKQKAADAPKEDTMQ